MLNFAFCCSGRYDPVLDDQEPLFDLIDQMEDESVDFVPLCDPSEVFTTIPDLSREPSVNPDAISHGSCELADNSRSLTASPFLLPSKPYRPFSTEPIPEVPPLEEPIVLNPDYHDEFGQPDDDFLPKSKFKLPVSEQYDPGTDPKSKSKKEGCARIDLSKKEMEVKEDLVFMKQMRQELDLERMETTAATVTELTNVAVAASSFVEESLFKAVTVAEEIKKEIDVEMTSSEVKSSKAQEFSDIKLTSESSEFTSSVVETSDLEQSFRTKKETIVDSKDESERKKTEIAELSQKEEHKNIFGVQEKKVYETKQEVDEKIVAGTVKRLSSNYEKDAEESSVSNIKKIIAKDTKTDVNNRKKDKLATQTDASSTLSSRQTIKTAQESSITETNAQKSLINENKNKFSTQRLLSEQRAYTIGLQTIPNIKGKVHSSYHYDLLLKTFFIHLTDVMVALSRFILAENLLGLEKEPSPVSQATAKENFTQNDNVVREEVLSTEEYKIREKIVAEHQEKVEDNKNITMYDNVNEIAVVEKELLEKHKISGAEMAQRTSKKSEELTEKMGAVITEFQSKAGIEEFSSNELSIQNRRSKSKSRIEEEVSHDSDPLEWLSKKEEAREVIAETVQACRAVEEVTQSQICVSDSMTETSTVEQVSKTENRENRRSRSKDRNTYIAIVESHVYTNKDTILEEHLSGGSSVQNSAEIKETTENVFLENSTFSKSIEETKQVTEEEVAMETATVNVNEIKKVFLDYAKGLSLAEVSQQHVSKVEEEHLQSSKVEEVATIIKKGTESEPRLQDLNPQIEPTEANQEDIQDTVQIPKEIPNAHLEKIAQISTAEQTSMSESHLESKLQSEISKTEMISKVQECRQITQRTDINQQTHKLSLDLKHEDYKPNHSTSPPSTIDTPTPATVPPTPLTDEYVFRLEIPMPKTSGVTPMDEPEVGAIPEEHEDLTIVQRKWDIDSPTIEAVIYDPPLASPVEVIEGPKVSNGILSDTSDPGPKVRRKCSLLIPEWF